MKIALHSKIFNSKKILDRLEEEFGGITQDKPDFLCSKDDINLVQADSDDHDALAYQASVINFLERRFPKTTAACK